MKQRISEQELLELTRSQRSALQGMWQPERYDVAVLMVCTDVEADQYQALPFIVGDVEVESINSEKKYEIRTMPVNSYDYCNVWLRNLEFQGNPEEADETVEAASEEDDFEDENGYEDDEEMDVSVIHDLIHQTAWFNKEDCLPLLNIGQMMAMIEVNQPQTDFRIRRNDKVYVCTVGGMEYEGEELCDVMWEIVKEML